MPKLILVSGKDVVKKLQRVGYRAVRQKGSHIRMEHILDKKKLPLTVPSHKLLGRGLLRKILRDADISVDAFNTL